MAEMFDILNEDGIKTGERKERKAVHADGDWHGSVHVWISRKGFDGTEFLLQKRSMAKDSFPGCYDAACTGHVDAGEDFIDAAVRETREELGIEALNAEYVLLFTQKVTHKAVYKGAAFISNEINNVYYLKKNINDSDIVFDKSEIDTVMWISEKKLLNALENGSSEYCISLDELKKVIPLIEELSQA